MPDFVSVFWTTQINAFEECGGVKEEQGLFGLHMSHIHLIFFGELRFVYSTL